MRADGRVSCWGSDLNGQLGNATHIDAPDIDVTEPADVLRVTGATQVAAGASDVRDARERHRGVLGSGNPR